MEEATKQIPMKERKIKAANIIKKCRLPNPDYMFDIVDWEEKEGYTKFYFIMYHPDSIRSKGELIRMMEDETELYVIV